MATNKGIDIRQRGVALDIKVSLKDTAGAKVTTGTTVCRILELQTDGTFKTYDFNDNTFKSTACTTPTLALTHRTANNATFNTGIWTVIQSTLTGFTVGNKYTILVNNSLAAPPDQEREWQYGDGEGDFSLDSSGRTTLTPTTIQAIWDALTSALTTAGSVGKALADYIAENQVVLNVPTTGTTDGNTLALTRKQLNTLMASLAAGGDTASGPPVASASLTVTYYMVGMPKIAGNIVAVATVSYDSNKIQTGRSTTLIQNPFPAIP